MKENSIRNQTENNNKKLGDMINTRDEKIQKLNDENNFLKKNNINSTNICSDLNNKIDVYKKHILTITEQNTKNNSGSGTTYKYIYHYSGSANQK